MLREGCAPVIGLWDNLPSGLLEVISEFVASPGAWRVWRPSASPQCASFRFLRVACSRLARLSAASLVDVRLARSLDSLSGVGDDSAWSRPLDDEDFLTAAFLALSDGVRYPSLARVEIRCRGPAVVKAAGLAFEARPQRAVLIDVLLDVGNHAIDANLLSTLGPRACGWPLSPPVYAVRRLVFRAGPHITDSMLDAVVPSFPALRELDARRCDQLSNPRCLATFGANCEERVVLRLDGCWRLCDSLMLELARRHHICVGTEGCHVDLFDTESRGWKTGWGVDVVILAGDYMGEWVPGSLVSRPLVQVGTGCCETCYNVLVHPTERCDAALGFANRIVHRVQRRHLRVADKGTFTRLLEVD